jgi:hypothetical protein
LPLKEETMGGTKQNEALKGIGGYEAASLWRIRRKMHKMHKK